MNKPFLLLLLMHTPSLVLAFENGCKIEEANDSKGRSGFYKIESIDHDGVPRTVYWKKEAESNKKLWKTLQPLLAGPVEFLIWKINHSDKGYSNDGKHNDKDGVIYPVYRNGTQITNLHELKPYKAAPIVRIGQSLDEKDYFDKKAANSEAVLACAKEGLALPTREALMLFGVEVQSSKLIAGTVVFTPSAALIIVDLLKYHLLFLNPRPIGNLI